MRPTVANLALWLADFHFVSAALLALALLAMIALRQPARRMALSKAALAALAGLAILCALPGWSLVHLLSADVTPAAPSTAAPLLSSPALAPPPALPPVAGPVPAFQPAVDAQPGEKARTPIDWIATALAVHAAGSLAVIVWLTIGSFAAHRVRRASQSAPLELVGALRAIVRDGQTPQLLVSRHVATPVALGVRHPAIILPASVARPDEPGILPPILAHEWAHISAGDLRTLAATRLLLVLLWPQPLYWLLRRIIRLDQETLADAAAAEVAGRVDYAEQLLAWARSALPRTPRLAGAVGLWEGPSQLKRRIAVLLDEKLTVLRACSRRWRVGSAFAALIAAGLLSLITLQRQEANAQATDDAAQGAVDQEPAAVGEEAQTIHASVGVGQVIAVPLDGSGDAAAGTAHAATPNTFAVRCVDASGAPLAGVTASLFTWKVRDGAPELVTEIVADADGNVQFADLASPERVQLYRQWSAAREHDPALFELAYVVALRREGLATTLLFQQEYFVVNSGYRADVTLAPGQELSGRVTAPDGKPVTGALVAAGSFAATLAIEGINAVRTDADGRYVFHDRPTFDAEAARKRSQVNAYLSLQASDEVAAQVERPAVGEDLAASNLVVTHPDFAVTAVQGGEIPGTLGATMLPAATIVGRVVDSQSGASVPGMMVRVCSRPELGVGADGVVFLIELDSRPRNGLTPLISSHAASTRTDSEGRYRIANLPAGVYDVWAAPTNDDLSQPSLFTHGLSALVVNAGGKPTTAPELVVGPGGLVRVQLLDAATGKPPQLVEGARVTASVDFVGGPQMQDQLPVKAPVSSDGKFEFRAAPGRFRAYLMVSAPGSENPNELAYGSSDNNFTTGTILEVDHGQSIDATLEVWDSGELQARREGRSKFWSVVENNKAEALAAFTEFLTKYPDDYDGLVGRARWHKDLGHAAEAIADFARVLSLHPNDIPAQFMLADLLATSADSAVRDGARAIELATAAIESLREQEQTNSQGMAAALSYLAAAYAETGQFDRATATQREALKLTDESRREDLEARLRLYESGQPFHRAQ